MSAIYKKAKQRLLEGGFDFTTDTLIALLVAAADYDLDTDTDEVLADIPPEAILASVELTGVTTTDGVFDCDNFVFPSVPATGQGDYIVFHVDSVEAPLFAVITEGLNLPIVPDGDDITVNVNASGVLSL